MAACHKLDAIISVQRDFMSAQLESEPKAHRKPPWHWPRLSLLSLLLLSALVCVVISHVRLAHENTRLKDENVRLMVQMGYLEVHNPDKIYLRQVESLDDLSWRFRVYLPPGKDYMLRRRTGTGSGGHSINHSSEQLMITIALRREPSGEWELRTILPDSAGLRGMDQNLAAKIAQMNPPSFLQTNQQELDPDKPVDLMNFLNGSFHVWIEKSDVSLSPRAKSSKGPPSE